MNNVLIAIDRFCENSTQPRTKLIENGFGIIESSAHSPISGNKENEWESIRYIIAGLELYDAERLDMFPRLRAISRVGVGTDNIDLDAARSRGIDVLITSDKPSTAVSELVIGNIITLLRRVHTMDVSLKAGNWMPIQGRNLAGCVVGIVGFGSIGKAVACRLKPFGVKVYAYGRNWRDEFTAEYSVERCESLVEIFKLSDIVTIHLPHTKLTDKIIGASLISQLKPGAVLINTSRAGVIDNQFLANSLRNNLIAGAAIDVFDEDRSVFPYGGVDNIILTPHIGSHTRETRKAMEQDAVDNILIHAGLKDEAD